MLIDYPALAQIHDLSGLLALLRRPSDKLTGFGEALSFVPKVERLPSRLNDHAASVAIAGVYGDGGRSTVLVPSLGEPENEALAMAVWRQAWPSLRRDFGFVTGISDRTIPVQAGCALRFGREPGEAPILDAGGRALLTDLPAAGPTALRTFLSRYVVEAPNPRAAAPKVATIWSDSGSDERTGVTTLAKLARSEGLPRLKRDLVAAELEASVGAEELIDLVREFGDESVGVLPAGARERLADLSPPQARQVLAAGSRAAEGTLGRLSFEEILSASDIRTLAKIGDRGLRPIILGERPDVALISDFWPDADAERADLVETLPVELAPNLSRVLLAMGAAVGPLSAAALISYVMRTEPLAIAGLVVDGGAALRKAAVGAIGDHPEIASRLAMNLRPGEFDLLEAMAEAFVVSGSAPERLPAWVEVVERVTDGQPAALGPFATVMVCALALRLGGRRGLDLALPVFESVLTSARRYVLSRDCDRWLERQIPSTSRGWSTQTRMRTAAVEAWPPGREGAGVLLLCSQSANISDLVDDVMVRHGRSALETALLDQQLPRMARDRVNARLSPPKVRIGLFGF